MNKFYKIIEKIGKRNFILIMFIVVVLLITGLYQTFSLYTESEGMTLVDGVKTYNFILNASNDTNAVTIASGHVKYIDITISNESEVELLYKLYYSSTADLSNVDVIYLPNTVHLPDGSINGNADYVVRVRVKNESTADITLNFGVKYGFINGGALTLSDNEYEVPVGEISNFMATLFTTSSDTTYDNNVTYQTKIKNASFLNYIESDTSKIVATWVVSESGDSSIVAWLQNNTTSGYYDLYIGAEKKIYAENFQYLFAGLSGLTSISFDNLDTSMVTNMSYMFEDCRGLTSLDLSSFNTSNVTSMSDMFASCYQLANLNINSFDTSNVTSMDYMFFECYALNTTITIRNPNVTYVNMFFDAASSGTVVINYTSETESLVQPMIKTKTDGNVVKGSLVV